jgi:hypothetical protein
MRQGSPVVVLEEERLASRLPRRQERCQARLLVVVIMALYFTAARGSAAAAGRTTAARPAAPGDGSERPSVPPSPPRPDSSGVSPETAKGGKRSLPCQDAPIAAHDRRAGAVSSLLRRYPTRKPTPPSTAKPHGNRITPSFVFVVLVDKCLFGGLFIAGFASVAVVSRDSIGATGKRRFPSIPRSKRYSWRSERSSRGAVSAMLLSVLRGVEGRPPVAGIEGQVAATSFRHSLRCLGLGLWSVERLHAVSDARHFRHSLIFFRKSAVRRDALQIRALAPDGNQIVVLSV